MQSTTVAVSGKGSNPKTTLYVGGLEESVNEAILHSAFIPFGECLQRVLLWLLSAHGVHAWMHHLAEPLAGSANRLQSCMLLPVQGT